MKLIILYDLPMSFRNICFKLVLLASLFLCAALCAAEDAQFLSIIDGDSMIVEFEGRSREVRLIGIDAPEWGQEYGTQAKSHALHSCYGKMLRLEFDRGRKDRYGRLLAYVYCGDRMLNEVMIRDGLAIAVKVKPNTKHYDRFKALEDEARRKKRGFWMRGGLKQTPAEWRKANGRR